MSRRIRNAGLAALIAMLIAGTGAAVAQQAAPSGSDPAPEMMQDNDSGMEGMMSMMEMMARMSTMMTLCEKMMETPPSSQESGDPT